MAHLLTKAKGFVEGISTLHFQSNAWEESKPGILTFLLGASRGGGAYFTPLSYKG